MAILQFQLQGGRNYVKLHKAIAQSNVTLQSVVVHMNVEAHGYYLARIRFPTHVINDMNARNDLYDNTEIIIPLSHKDSTTIYQPRWGLGNISFPSSMEIDVDLDNGVQIVPRQNTGYDGAVYQDNTGQWFPAGATGNNTLTTNTGFGTPAINQAAIQGNQLKNNNNFVSVGLLADKLADHSTGSGNLNDHQLNNTTGAREGFVPFMYSMILTLEYDGTATEARIQSMF
jgi:hypothetical protein